MATKFFNLDEVVREWAWSEYDKFADCKQKKLRQKDKKNPRKYLRLEIDWSETKFHDQTQWAPLRQDSGDPQTSQNNGAAVGHAGVVRSGPQPQSSQPQSVVLFETSFTNSTEDMQQYTMRTEKKTLTSMSTSVEHGYTKGFEMSVKLASPCELFEANAGYKREVTLTNVDGETFEEELTWGVESQISVKKGHVAEASLVVDERRQASDFVVVTRVSGIIYASFTSPQDNNSLVKAMNNDVADIVAEYLEREEKKKTAPDYVEVDGKTVIIKTKGSCKFRYGIKQDIHVRQRKIDE